MFKHLFAGLPMIRYQGAEIAKELCIFVLAIQQNSKKITTES